ncbi:MAG TPA: cupin domain-containing protein [Calditrichia bacterium]|nr:cupin domain-containing protein [Calditrichota bacterium]HQV31694.1 cupin domain-containing protein [Calditrichia bacterium]
MAKTFRQPQYFLIPRQAVDQDPLLRPGASGDRKLAVTTLYPDLEVPQTQPVWGLPPAGELPEVLITENLEIAVFTHNCRQERHFHRRATEIYEVLSGRLEMTVQEEELSLNAGDMVVLQPGTVHFIHADRSEFLARVILVNAVGPEDKIVPD